MNGNKLWIWHYDQGFQEAWGVVFAETSEAALKMLVDEKVAAKTDTEEYAIDHMSVDLGAPYLGGIVRVHSIYHGD